MAGGVALRIVETFFRRWWLFLIPTIVLCAVGVVATLSSADVYKSTAVLRASQGSLLSDITEIGAEQPTFAEETPATITGRRISELLRTDDFVDRIAADGRLDADAVGLAERGEIRDDIREAVAVRSEGENLVFIEATTNDPEMSRLLAQATIDTFVQWVIDANATESDAAELFLSDVLNRYESEFLAAATELDNYLIENPEPSDPEISRPSVEQTQIDRLASTAEAAQERYTGALRQLEEVQLGRQQTVADTRQRLSVIDPPIAPTTAESGIAGVVLGVGVFTLIGALLSGLAVVLLTLLDRSLRFAGEIRSTLGVEVLAVVPAESRRQLAKARRTAATIPGGVDITDRPLFHATTPAINESMRYMLARLQLNGVTGVPHRLAMTSALRGEGVSFLAKSFAAVLAHDFDRSVCLVDLNWWDSKWDREQDNDDATLATVYRGESDLAEAITATSMPGLSSIAAGRLAVSERPVATASTRLAELLDELAADFDHLVLDLPAVLSTSGALPLARFCDSYALVVRQGVTSRHHVASALDELRRVVSIGVILNANETTIPTRLRRLFGL